MELNLLDAPVAFSRTAMAFFDRVLPPASPIYNRWKHDAAIVLAHLAA
jgi:hypothetical protein